MTDANTTPLPPFSTSGQSCADYRRGPGHWPRHCLFAGKARCLDCGSGRTLSKCEKTVADVEARFTRKAVAIECDISNLDALDALAADA